jgi:hypothetical protein
MHPPHHNHRPAWPGVSPPLQVCIQRADPTIAEEAGAALWQPASGGCRMAGAIHAAGTQVQTCAIAVTPLAGKLDRADSAS